MKWLGAGSACAKNHRWLGVRGTGPLTTASVARFGVPDREGTNGLPFRSEGDAANASNDPRVASTRRTGAGVGFDGVTPQWIQTKHGKRDSLAIIADGVEARLIQPDQDRRVSVVDLVDELVDACDHHARALGCSEELASVRDLCMRNGCTNQLAVARRVRELPKLVEALADDFA